MSQERGSALPLVEQKNDPTTADLGTRLPAMLQDLLTRAACFFQRVPQDRQAIWCSQGFAGSVIAVRGQSDKGQSDRLSATPGATVRQ
jgi:hypothetical protein